MTNSKTGNHDESRVRAAYDFRDSLSALNERLGREDMEEWRKNAPEKHPSKREPDGEERA